MERRVKIKKFFIKVLIAILFCSLVIMLERAVFGAEENFNHGTAIFKVHFFATKIDIVEFSDDMSDFKYIKRFDIPFQVRGVEPYEIKMSLKPGKYMVSLLVSLNKYRTIKDYKGFVIEEDKETVVDLYGLDILKTLFGIYWPYHLTIENIHPIF